MHPDSATSNLGPAFGFAWRPLGAPDTVLRGGYGIYYEQEHPSRPVSSTRLTRRRAVSELRARSRAVSDSPVTTPRPRLRRTRAHAVLENFSAGTAVIPARIAVSAVDPRCATRTCSSGIWPYSEPRIQRFEVGYVANKSNKIYTSQYINRPGDFDSRFVRGTGAPDPPRLFSDQLAPGGRIRSVSLAANEVRAPRAQPDIWCPTPGSRDKRRRTRSERSRCGQPRSVPLPLRPWLDKSSTTFDIRQRLTSAVVYDTPFMTSQQGVLGRILGGWQTNFIFTVRLAGPPR